MHHHISEFLWSVLDNWAGFATGGIVAAIAWVWLGWRQKSMTRKALGVLCLCFLVMAVYKAWDDQYEKAGDAGKATDDALHQTHEYGTTVRDQMLTINHLNEELNRRTNNSPQAILSVEAIERIKQALDTTTHFGHVAIHTSMGSRNYQLADAMRNIFNDKKIPLIFIPHPEWINSDRVESAFQSTNKEIKADVLVQMFKEIKQDPIIYTNFNENQDAMIWLKFGAEQN